MIMNCLFQTLTIVFNVKFVLLMKSVKISLNKKLSKCLLKMNFNGSLIFIIHILFETIVDRKDRFNYANRAYNNLQIIF